MSIEVSRANSGHPGDYTGGEKLQDVSADRPHVVILGAGASLAAFPKGDRNGRRLPLMDNFAEVVGLGKLLDSLGVDWRGRNFEEMYGQMHEDPARSADCAAIEREIFEYFAGMQLPDEATLYDYLVLSLRPKDVLATFNWDPFLFDACARNKKVAPLPKVAFLHGNVRTGYCLADRVRSRREWPCPRCQNKLEGSRLLYPVQKKDYSADEFVSSEWMLLRQGMRFAFAITIYGYGAPASDVDAVTLLKEGWGDPLNREMEETEIIDIRPEDDLQRVWSPFIHSHHYQVHDEYWDSLLALHPRRSIEALAASLLDARFVDSTPLPRTQNLEDLHAAVRSLVEVERATG